MRCCLLTVLFHLNNSNHDSMIGTLSDIPDVLHIALVNNSTDIIAVFRANYNSELIRIIADDLYPVKNNILNMMLIQIKSDITSDFKLKENYQKNNKLIFA